ncbi:MAG: hypothetical protein WAV66_09710, partial [Anaerolineae bacterium]
MSIDDRRPMSRRSFLLGGMALTGLALLEACRPRGTPPPTPTPTKTPRPGTPAAPAVTATPTLPPAVTATPG